MSEFTHSYALVIGINDYGSGITSLKTAVSDATEIACILETEHHYTVTLLLNVAATLSDFRRVLEIELPKQIQSGDRFLFYFAGHGIALNGEDGPEGYLIPQDARSGNVSTYLRMSEVNKALLQLPCRHFLGILDCCFAGAFRWSSLRKAIAVELGTLHKERYDRFIQDPAWQVVTSSAYDQSAWDAFDLKDDRGQLGSHSPFACALIEALEGKADAFPPAELGKPAGDGVITATELYLYLRDRVEIATEARAIRQTPGIHCLNKHDKGEYIFLTPGHALNLPPAPPLDASKNPYRGLSPFEEEHCNLFFGRKALTQKLYEFVTSNTLTVVLGASGSGKSSLVKAGLIPKLRQCKDDNTWFILPPFRPSESPFKAFNNALASVNLPVIATPNEATSSVLLTPAESLANWFKEHPQANLLLVVDQFEELITLCRDDQEQQQFLEALAGAIATYPKQLHLVLTLRSDFEPQFRNTVLEKNWQAARFIVPAMTREELRQAIEEPASAMVMYFDPHELVERLIDEVANMPGALPLLSFALSELYLRYLKRQEDTKNRGETIDRSITQADYEELGGVTRSLTQRADREYEELVNQDPAYAQTVRHLMLRMVAVGEELARRQVPESELKYPEPENARVQEVIGRFSSARLLVSGADVDRNPYIEPAHDALVRGWEKLLIWKKKEEENLILQRLLTPVAILWNDNKVKGYLWANNPRLLLLKEILDDKKNNWLNVTETNFVRDSLRLRLRNRISLWSSIGIVVSLLSLAAWIANNQRLVAEQENINSLTLLSESSLRSNQQFDALIAAVKLGIKLKDRCILISGSTRYRGVLALYQAVYHNREINRFEGKNSHKSGILSTSFSPDGKLLASGDEGDFVKLWKIDGSLHKSLDFPTQLILGLSFSPDSKEILAVDRDNRVQAWSTIDGRLVKDRLSSPSIIYLNGIRFNSGFSSAGRKLALSYWPKLWDSEQQNQFFPGILSKISSSGKFIGNVTRTSLSPDGKLFAIGVSNNIEIWDNQGFYIKTLKGHKDEIVDISFNPSANIIVSVAKDNTMKKWTLKDGRIVKDIPQESPFGINFTEDGRNIISVSKNGRVNLIESENFNIEKEKSFNWDSMNATSITFSPDGNSFVTGYSYGTLKHWSINEFSLEPKVYTHHDSCSLSSDDKAIVYFSPDGTSIISNGCYDIRIWNTNGTLRKIIRNSDHINDISFSVKRKLFLASSENFDALLYDFNGDLIKTYKNSYFSILNTGGDQIISLRDSFVEIKNINTDELIYKSLKFDEDCNRFIRFSPDKKIIAVIGDTKICLINLDTKTNKTINFKNNIAILRTVFNWDAIAAQHRSQKS